MKKLTFTRHDYSHGNSELVAYLHYDDDVHRVSLWEGKTIIADVLEHLHRDDMANMIRAIGGITIDDEIKVLTYSNEAGQ